MANHQHEKQYPSQEISEHRHETLLFPKGFLWGTATAAHQVEGDNIHADWWKWEQEHPEKVHERSLRAVDHYHRYEEDLNFARELGTNSYRFSVEWSRVEPHEGAIDRHELEHYGNVLRAARVRGMKTMLTLHHFTNPQWFADKGGWRWSGASKAFEQFTKLIAEEFVNLVDQWCTFNEPMAYVSGGYISGFWPPGKKNHYFTAYRVYRHLASAHRKAYRAIHAVAFKKGVPAFVGSANNIISLYAYRKHSIVDRLVAWGIDALWNHSFLNVTEGYHDYLGVNYYFHQRVSAGRGRLFGLIVDTKEEQREMSDIGWEIYPSGLFDILLDLQSYKLPIYITENGIATKNDDRRARYIVSYVKELYHAIAAGIDVRGYYYWSLLDNYEWEKGMSANFGLIRVDPKTLDRTVKPSAKIYEEIAKANGIPHSLLRFLGHGAR